MKLLQRWKQTALHNKALVLTGVLVAAGTLFYAGAATFQIYLMKSTAEQATLQTERFIVEANRISNSMEKTLEQSKKALGASIEMARQDQRAWVGTAEVTEPNFKEDSRKVHIKEGEKIAFGIVIINSGKTPARKFRAIAGNRILPSKTPFTPDYPKTIKFQSTSIIQPGMKLTLPFTREETLTKETIDAIKSNQAILYAYGMMNYEDIFGVSHKTTFCMFLQKNLSDFATCDTHNEAD
jgi:hypothetical protein